VNTHAERIHQQLARGPAPARQLVEKLEISQPTLSRALSAMGDDIVRIGAARSIQYALRDTRRGLSEWPVYRVGTDGRLLRLGLLVPVCPEGFVMQQADGVSRHSEGLPWWLLDMRPQGFLGRAYAARHAQALGLPAALSEWSDAHALRALLVHGHDAVGNLLLGDLARERFLSAPAPVPIAQAGQGLALARMAREAAAGDAPGSSAGGEQPKFTAFIHTPDGPCHVLVKFTLPDANPVTERWRDLLLAEHHALETLSASGIAAARSWVLDQGGQRFLQIERFDRVGASGRRGLYSLTAVEAEFVGDASAPWPVIVDRLASDGHVTPASAHSAALLYAFGTLIGNTDMHNGNLSFVSDQGRPYALAPAYDMLPMGLAPRTGGALPLELPAPRLRACVDNAVWARALGLAAVFLGRLQADDRFSDRFRPCLRHLAIHLEAASAQAARLG
jgi:HipA-like C-terminal domain